MCDVLFFSLALITGLAVWFVIPQAAADGFTAGVLPTAVTASAVLAGSTWLAQAILRLNGAGRYATLIGYQQAAVRAQVLFAAAGFLVMALRACGSRPPLPTSLAPAALAFLGVRACRAHTRQTGLAFELLRGEDTGGYHGL